MTEPGLGMNMGVSRLNPRTTRHLINRISEAAVVANLGLAVSIPTYLPFRLETKVPNLP